MTHPLTTLDPTNRVLKRGQYEAFTCSIFEDGVLVRNESHLHPAEHEYLVTVDGGVPVACACPADIRFDGPCKHRVAVAIRRPILELVSDVHLVADGGPKAKHVETDELGASEADDENTTAANDDDASDTDGAASSHMAVDCDCHLLDDDFPCWECVTAGRRRLPDA